MTREKHIVKLVRDRIPEIVARECGSGKASYRVAGAREFSRLLRDKLREEVAEFLAGGKPEELADILEVVRALSEEAGIRPRELERMRKSKTKERGGFRGRKVMRFKKKVTRGYEKLRKVTRGYAHAPAVTLKRLRKDTKSYAKIREVTEKRASGNLKKVTQGYEKLREDTRGYAKTRQR